MSFSEGEKVSIVVCDDQPAVAHGLAQVLEAQRDEISVVGVATSAAEVEALVRETIPDVVVMDIYMPGVDGIEATRRIRTASPSTDVVILTFSDQEDDLYKAVKAGALGYETKDRDAAAIAEVVMAVHHKNYALPADLAGQMLADLEGRNAVDDLDVEERTILREIAAGRTDKQIARALHLSERTIRRRIHNIYEKLHIADRIQAAIFAAQRGLAPEEAEDASDSDPGKPDR